MLPGKLYVIVIPIQKNAAHINYAKPEYIYERDRICSLSILLINYSSRSEFWQFSSTSGKRDLVYHPALSDQFGMIICAQIQ